MAKKVKKEGSGLFSKIACFFGISAILSSIFAIYELLLLSSIETLIRYIVIGIFIFIDIFILFKC